MRITGGTHRSRTLFAPKDNAIRPTSDKVRKAMFDILGTRISGAKFLDCYAGTGAVGLEAISRGAIAATLVEQDRNALILIRKNAGKLDLDIELIPDDFIHTIERLKKSGRKFDLIFIDPPYRDEQQTVAIEKIDSSGLIDSEGTVIVEHEIRLKLPENIGNLNLNSQRKYGKTGLSFFTNTR